MASGERFYMLELRHRPAVYGDLGNLLKIEGLVVGGEGARAILLLPSAEGMNRYPDDVPPVHHLTMEEWTDFLMRTDSPEVLVMPGKAFHRKVRFEISGAVQQKIWMADKLRCVYCGAYMGNAQLTIDHWVPLELGGVNNTSNFLAACKKCNKNKGAMDPKDWCSLKGYDYNYFVEYLKMRQLP